MATTSVTAGAPPVRPSRRKSAQRGGLIAWTFALPALAVYFVFLVYPAITSLFFSFTDWDGLSATYNIVGVDNYVDMVADPVVIQAMVNNLIWTVVTITVPVIIGLLLAIALNGKVRASRCSGCCSTPRRCCRWSRWPPSGAGCTTRSTAPSTPPCVPSVWTLWPSHGSVRTRPPWRR